MVICDINLEILVMIDNILLFYCIQVMFDNMLVCYIALEIKVMVGNMLISDTNLQNTGHV